jgi:predicted GIY-YIG superfamily endonuclease
MAKSKNTENTPSDRNKNKPRKWIVFTYHSPRIRKLTNLFKHTDTGIAFRSNNTVQQLTKQKPQNHTQEHNNSGVYKLTCNTCKLAYIGQTSRNLKQRYHEHIRYIRNNNPQSAYAQHILKHQHEYGPITDIMTLLKPEQKTSMLIPYEQLYIQTYHHNGHLIPEQSTGDINPLIQLIIDTYHTTGIATKANNSQHTN